MNTPVKFKIAKLLKEKGFTMFQDNFKSALVDTRNYKTQRYSFYKEYHDENYTRKIELNLQVGTNSSNIFGLQESYDNPSSGSFNFYFAPTIAEVVMWLYEKHGIWIWVEQEDTTNEFQWLCRYENKGCCKDYDDKFYNSPTESYKAAIEYTLKNLIKNQTSKL